MRYCQKCGTAADESNRFCVSCGEPLESAPAAVQGGLFTSHPVLIGIVAIIAVGVLAAVGLAVANRSASPPTTVPAFSARYSTLTVTRTACQLRYGRATLASESRAREYLPGSGMGGVLCQCCLGMGEADRLLDPCRFARSAEDAFLMDTATGGLVDFSQSTPCQLMTPIPAAVLAGWNGIWSHQPAGQSPGGRCSNPTTPTTMSSPTTTTTLAPATTTTLTPTPTATPAPSPGWFTGVTGSWAAHDHWMTISASGSGALKYLDFSQCPSCDPGDAPASTLTFQLTSGGAGSAAGTVTTSSDSSLYPVGASVQLALTASSPSKVAEGAPAQTLSVSIGPNPDDQNVPFCAPPDPNNWCGEGIA